MSDEVCDQFLYDGCEHVSLLDCAAIHDRLIVFNGWSKTYTMAGWRRIVRSGLDHGWGGQRGSRWMALGCTYLSRPASPS